MTIDNNDDANHNYRIFAHYTLTVCVKKKKMQNVCSNSGYDLMIEKWKQNWFSLSVNQNRRLPRRHLIFWAWTRIVHHSRFYFLNVSKCDIRDKRLCFWSHEKNGKFKFVQRWVRLNRIVLLECAHNLIYARCFSCCVVFYFFFFSFYNEQTRADRRHDVCYWSNKLLYSFCHIMKKFILPTKSFAIKTKQQLVHFYMRAPNRATNVEFGCLTLGRHLGRIWMSQHILFKCFFVFFFFFIFLNRLVNLF